MTKKNDKQTKFVSAQLPIELVKSVRIAAIQDGVLLRDWIGQAIVQRLQQKSIKNPSV